MLPLIDPLELCTWLVAVAVFLAAALIGVPLFWMLEEE
jgi:hypothetical protein